jgi:hypothetical protein
MSNKTRFNSNKPTYNLSLKNHNFKHKNLKEIKKKGKEPYLGWREITNRQEHVRKAREKLKKIIQTTKKSKEGEKCHAALGESNLTLKRSSSGRITKSVRT